MNDLINEEMLELVKTEEELFDLWKKRRLVFCEDGILNKEMYDKSEIKVLFALKDVNNLEVNRVKDEEMAVDGKSIDMKRVFRESDEKNERTWKPVFSWLKYLLHKESADEYFAFINLKKDEGLGSVGFSTLQQYAQRDADLIRKQIELIAPDLIISCGRDVFECLCKNVFNEQSQNVSKLFNNDDRLDYGKMISVKNGDKITHIVEYHHPTARVNQSYSEEEHIHNMDVIREKLFGLDT